MIERKILIGLITSQVYTQKIRNLFDVSLLESVTAKLIATWCFEYYDIYQKPIGKNLETVFFKKLKEGLDKDTAEELEQDILPELSDEYLDGGVEVTYLLDETIKHLNARKLTILSENINNLIENGSGALEDRLKKVEQLRSAYVPIKLSKDEALDLSTDKAQRAIRRAFAESSEPVVRYPKQLGAFWNHQFIPGALIGFLAPEKRGKTTLLLDVAMRGTKQGKNVAFFQAGDMNESDQLKRLTAYLTGRSNLEIFCKEHYQPIRDCRLNQLNDCNKKERECDFGIWDNYDGNVDLDKITMAELQEAFETNLEYRACHNCKEYQTQKLGAPWIKKIDKVEPLLYTEAQKAVKEFYTKTAGKLRISTHANGTLSIDDVLNILKGWLNDFGFVPHIILIDYADILVPSAKTEFRHQQNQIWKDLRKLSQTYIGDILPLVIVPTQSDTGSYKVHRLSLDNFSEDKRKYGHVTAMYGLNQDPSGREKSIGLMRINEILLRSGSFSSNNEITLLQDLSKSRAFLGSYF